MKKAEDLWLEFCGPDALPTGGVEFFNGFPVMPNEHCGLCGNSGIIDTIGKTFTAAGRSCGVRRWCICPNGRAFAEQCKPAIPPLTSTRKERTSPAMEKNPKESVAISPELRDLFEEVDQRLEHIKKENAIWVKEFEKDPDHALRWASKVYGLAGEGRVLNIIKRGIERGVAGVQLRERLTTKLLEETERDSGSDCSRISERAFREGIRSVLGPVGLLADHGF